MIKRRITRQVSLGSVKIGRNSPVSIQSMTKTDTRDIAATVRQVKSLESLGCEIIRVAVKDISCAQAIKKIKSKIKIPLEADIHFDYRLALEAIASGSDSVRLNPGNIRKKEHVVEVIKACRKKNIPVRIGLNSGSAGTNSAKGMVKAALDYLKIFEKEKFFDIMISLKASDVYTTICAYREMAKVCDYPFHLGVTAAGSAQAGLIKSSIGIGALLADGIGDTIRVSLTGEPENEVIAAKHILQSLGLRKFFPEIIACPTCGRCQVDLSKIVNNFYDAMLDTKYSTLNTKIALMGCEVNGPGEAKEADMGIAFGKNAGTLFKKGKIIKKVSYKDAVKELIKLI
ncbi:MAG: flavodoxin-dependent (E)-4-hydroxy-3-methylbut-2-enyl-diphosphate synthase [Candidatus Omnitrophica bacterium]|nr:flavodoxin-dependent (E)-4-hydroxy-3-methylbut-2-enyl-diphosphate synthase [Candidatus Omnitrophota bacterium]